MVKQLFVVRLSFPSTTPSTKRSSLPVTSPLILIPWLMHAAAGDELGSPPDSEGVLAGALLDELPEFAGGAVVPETPSGFKSSFFHIRHLDIENWIFEAAYRRAGWTATRKTQHITRLNGCKQGMPGSRPGGFPEELHH
jgi:hypothetical protein